MFSLSSDVLFLCNDTGTLIRILCQNESLTLSGEERVLIVKTGTEFVEQDTASAPNPTPSTTVSTGCYYRQKGVLKFRPMAGGAVYNITILRGDRVSDAIRKISAKAGNAVNITTHCLCYRNGAQLTEDNEFCLADILTRVIGRKPQVYVAARPENQDDFDDNSYENAYETPLSDIPNGTRIDAETQTCNVLLEGLIQMKMRKTKTLMKTSHVRTAEQDLSKWFPYASRAWISDIPH
ncbi:hypothetical protein Y032_0095g2787 [Ancylostoma ceylanicum]|uniref:Uncharacterized protein n=1 Tax=Ancylostoma ceylanicum TaxID=53326 RepID=A0A016TKP7_9BILA|nr:hypothetical protein Y032_0095g2787 [Ancylostoma ceylanicum]